MMTRNIFVIVQIRMKTSFLKFHPLFTRIQRIILIGSRSGLTFDFGSRSVAAAFGSQGLQFLATYIHESLFWIMPNSDDTLFFICVNDNVFGEVTNMYEAPTSFFSDCIHNFCSSHHPSLDCRLYCFY